MEQPKLNVHSIQVGHTVAAQADGTLATVKQLTYHVGKHGPFTHHYKAGDGTAERMTSDIGAQKAELQQVTALEEPPNV